MPQAELVAAPGSDLVIRIKDSTILDFVPKDAYLIYALISKAWRQLWRYGTTSHLQHFTTSIELAQLALQAHASRWTLLRRMMTTESTETVKHVIAMGFDAEHANEICHMAVLLDRLDVVAWVYSHRNIRADIDLIDIAAAAADHDRVDILVWIEDICPERLDFAILHAIESGNTHALEWLHSKGYANNDAFYVAIREGSIDMLQWLIDHGYEFRVRECFTDMFDDVPWVARWLYNRGYL